MPQLNSDVLFLNTIAFVLFSWLYSYWVWLYLHFAYPRFLTWNRKKKLNGCCVKTVINLTLKLVLRNSFSFSFCFGTSNFCEYNDKFRNGKSINGCHFIIDRWCSFFFSSFAPDYFSHYLLLLAFQHERVLYSTQYCIFNFCLCVKLQSHRWIAVLLIFE